MLLRIGFGASKVFLKKSGNKGLTFFMFYPELVVI